ncbi:hypothetical protein J0A68_22090 [Algoriphagus sp. H41]|uniref:Uncharacterized protein n=1 Tax=Algoriphagus oliviformis TaxID=2811231 RepID=A0ABS3C9E0_9BACT|nr:hypothetical protein [Algoriphagus oliviformis]MBN7813663.1 hypothetical protein [Algoriphagus oliviformis]
MSTFRYSLGPVRTLNELFPAAKFANKNLNFRTRADVIRHYTQNSLSADRVSGIEEVRVYKEAGDYYIELSGSTPTELLKTFAARHVKIFDADNSRKAIRGKRLMKRFGVWNPMANYSVNKNPYDGPSKWTLFPPLGLNVIGQKGLLLLHYPPWAVLQAGTFENAMTMQRWGRMLAAAGVPAAEVDLYKTFIDVNPVAAPGSGESEYPNDYMPIMMASAFFDGPSDRDYIKSMLELYLTPPGWPEDSKYTLPLLICGSPLYDPQAPGWFRTAYTDILPTLKGESSGVPYSIPLVDVMQTGKFKVRPDSKRETPYLIGNHMIAAGVTGKCTPDASQIPDIRQYEAQDLVAATFLKLYTENPNLEPEDAKAQASKRWFGNESGTGVPNPPDPKDALTLCALAQMDLFFKPNPPSPLYNFEEACKRCQEAKVKNDPCASPIGPTDPNKIGS